MTKERWRILAPLSQSHPPEARKKLVARLNGLLEGKLAGESFTLSQSYYYGSINDNSNHRVEVIDGDFIDLRDDLDAGAIGKKGSSANGDDDGERPNLNDARSMPRGGWLTDKLIELLETPNLGRDKKHGKYDGRGSLMFAFLTGCARRDVPKQVAHDLCVDAQYAGKAICEHCRDNAHDQGYLEKQIEHAYALVEQERDAKIAEINAHHALVLSGNKASVMKFEDVTKFRLLQVGAFRQWYANQFITVGKKVTTVGDFWLSHPQRRSYEGIEFEPVRGRPGYYNLWQGFAVEPKEGDCSKFLAHVRDNAARGDDATFLWIIGWFAQIVQQLTVKTETALVLRGPRGTGKTKVGQVTGSLFGDHYLLVSNPRYITGQFNSHMASLLLLHADEAFWAGDKTSVGTLNDLVTGHEHMIEFKRIDPIRVKNFIRLFVCGNPTWLIPAGFKERRWAVFDMGEGRIQDHAYFAAIDHEMNNGGRAALLHYLLKFDLSKVNLRVIPKTAALLDQQIESMSPEQAWWFDTLTKGLLPPKVPGENATGACFKEALHNSYVRHAQQTGVSRRSAEVKLGIFLTSQLGADLKTNRLSVGNSRPRYYQLPSLKDCRERFAQKLGQPVDWGADWEAEDWENDTRSTDQVF